MITPINEPVSVKLVYSSLKQTVYPEKIYWRNKVYLITKVGLHHVYKEGETLKHIFTVVSKETAFRLSLDTQTLHWTLEEIYDDAS